MAQGLLKTYKREGLISLFFFLKKTQKSVDIYKKRFKLKYVNTFNKGEKNGLSLLWK